MARQFSLRSTLKWRTADGAGVFVEYNEGGDDAYVPGHQLDPAGLRALASACLDAAAHIEGAILDSMRGDSTSQLVARVEAAAAALPERPLIPSTALQAQAVSAPVAEPEEPAEHEEDLGPPVEVRRQPRAAETPEQAFRGRPKNLFPTGGYE
jgi:hypothetical protein